MQCRRLAALRHASAMRLIAFTQRFLAMPKHFLALPSHITSMPCQALPCRRNSVPCYAFAPPCVAVHVLASASLLDAVLRHCVAFPELRKTKPLLIHARLSHCSSSLRCTHALLCITPARLLSAQPYRGHALLFLRVATQYHRASRPRHAFALLRFAKAGLCYALPWPSLSLRVNASALPVNALRNNA